MRIVAAAIFTLSIANVFAQTNVGSTDIFDRRSAELPVDSAYYTLPPYEYWDQQPWRDSVYRFESFQEGRFEFANGFSPSTRLNMNYNFFLGTIDILVSNQVSELKKFPELKVIWIGDHKFFYHTGLGYLEIILDGKISVATKTVMATVIEFSDGFRLRIPPIDDSRTTPNKSIRHYWPVELYFFLDEGRRVYRAGTLALPTILPDLKVKIQNFAMLNQTDYKNKDDVLKVARFCNEYYIKPPERFGVFNIRDSIYMFREFQEATLTYINGSKETESVNYNFETGWFDAIGKKGDTLGLSTTARIVLANVDGVTLLNHPVLGLVEIVMQGKTGLGLRKRVILEPGYEETVYHTERTWFFVREQRLLVANMKTLESLFPRHKAEIEQYVNANALDLGSKKDLMNLLSFCSRF